MNGCCACFNLQVKQLTVCKECCYIHKQKSFLLCTACVYLSTLLMYSYLYMYKTIVQFHTCELITIVKLVSDSTMKLTSCLSSSVYSCKLPSHVVVILCSLCVQFVNITRAQYLESYSQTHFRVVKFTFLGAVYFTYPFLGHLADVKS